jgi:hypothetical protein
MKQNGSNYAACCIVSIASLFFSCASSPCFKSNPKHHIDSKLQNASWLIGEWKNQSQNTNTSEIWTRVNDSMFSATSFIVKGKDTLSKEHIQLIQNGNSVFYIPTVDGQNGGKPVFFKAITFTKKRLVFQNKAHDFPQEIKYNRVGKDSLVAQISGWKRGKKNSFIFPMKKLR